MKGAKLSGNNDFLNKATAPNVNNDEKPSLIVVNKTDEIPASAAILAKMKDELHIKARAVNSINPATDEFSKLTLIVTP